MPSESRSANRSRRLAIMAAAIATAGAVVLPAANGSAATSATASTNTATAASATQGGNPHPGWARTISGQLVPVGPGHDTTPVNPTAATHPETDWMGSTVGAHEPAAATAPSVTPYSVPQLPGIDVSGYQGNLNWATIAPHIDFVYAKATEGTSYQNQNFYNQYVGPYNAGLIRGAYHFATPNNSGGATQADYFVDHGGGWSADGKTLPGALDIEYNPYGATCYGLSRSQMTSWIWAFVNEYAYRTGVYPVIYTTRDWWSTCTSSDAGFADYVPLWIANYSASAGGALPNGWGFYTFWQYADHGSQPGDQDVFNGPYTQLQTLATRG